MTKGLPKNYWDFIAEYLPGYSNRDDVLRSDIYTRYLEGGEICDKDYQNFFAGRSRDDIEHEYISNEWTLFLEAFSAFASARYGSNRSNGQEYSGPR